MSNLGVRLTPIISVLAFGALAWAIGLSVAPPAGDVAAAIVDKGRVVSRQLAVPDGEAKPMNDDKKFEVTLPDGWVSRPDRQVQRTVYQLVFQATEEGPLWIYVPRVRTNAEFRVNSHVVWSGGSMRFPLARNAHTPILFSVPDKLAHPGENVLEVEVASSAGTNGGLSRVYLGSRAALWPLYAERHFWQQTSVFVTSGIIAATSLYILFIWIETGRRRSGYLLLALAGLVWAARNLNLVWIGGDGWTESAQRWMEHAAFLGHGVFFGLLGLFLLDEYEPQGSKLRGVMSNGILFFVFLGPLLFVVFPGPSPAMTIWLLAAAPILAGMLFVLARHAHRQRTIGTWLFFAMFLLLIVLNVHDNLVLIGKLNFERVNLAHFGGLAFFLAIAHMLVGKYSEAMLAVEKQYLVLEDRLAAQERELSKNYAAMGAMEKESAIIQERGRIMRDLHDGMGAQLLSAVHSVRRGSLDSKQTEEVLQDCLADMRLVIEVSEPKISQLGTVLGSVRYHLEQRLTAAGLRMRWEVGDLPEDLDLGPTRTLQIVRIIQEAVSNVIKHADATTVTVEVRLEGKALTVRIADDGKGFLAIPEKIGFGVENMRRRANDIGATVRVASGSVGTVVELIAEIGAAPEYQG